MMLGQRLQQEQVWLFGSRAMGRHSPGSDLDFSLIGNAITHQDRLRLMHAIDELLLPSSVDLALWHKLPEDLREHLQRAGRCLWTQQRSASP